MFLRVDLQRVTAARVEAAAAAATAGAELKQMAGLDERARALFAAIDVDGSGAITADELLGALADPVRGGRCPAPPRPARRLSTGRESVAQRVRERHRHHHHHHNRPHPPRLHAPR